MCNTMPPPQPSIGQQTMMLTQDLWKLSSIKSHDESVFKALLPQVFLFFFFFLQAILTPTLPPLFLPAFFILIY